jgi:hypothetical protein
MEDQITRFAPGFRDCVLARSVSTPAALERWNPNLIGGDILVAPWIFDSSFFAPPHRCIVLRKEGCICAEHLPRLEVECTGWPDIMQQKLLYRLEIVNSLAWICDLSRRVLITLPNDLEKIIADLQ